MAILFSVTTVNLVLDLLQAQKIEPWICTCLVLFEWAELSLLVRGQLKFEQRNEHIQCVDGGYREIVLSMFAGMGIWFFFNFQNISWQPSEREREKEREGNNFQGRRRERRKQNGVKIWCFNYVLFEKREQLVLNVYFCSTLHLPFSHPAYPPS